MEAVNAIKLKKKNVSRIYLYVEFGISINLSIYQCECLLLKSVCYVYQIFLRSGKKDDWYDDIKIDALWG